MHHTRQLTPSALLADMMNEHYDLSEKELIHNLGTDWHWPMRDLVQLNLVSTFINHGERYFAISRG
jgi:hypothetical protein